MKTIPSAHCDILFLAANAEVGPRLPAPESISQAVAHLLDQGLLCEIEGRIRITESGQRTLRENRERATVEEALDAYVASDLRSQLK